MEQYKYDIFISFNWLWIHSQLPYCYSIMKNDTWKSWIFTVCFGHFTALSINIHTSNTKSRITCHADDGMGTLQCVECIQKVAVQLSSQKMYSTKKTCSSIERTIVSKNWIKQLNTCTSTTVQQVNTVKCHATTAHFNGNFDTDDQIYVP